MGESPHGDAEAIDEEVHLIRFGGVPIVCRFAQYQTIVRTSDSPQGVMPQSTYVGGEAGLLWMSVRIGLGAAHRVSGPGPRDTVFTWNVGFRTGW
jgi:hypothetical protein